MTVHVADVLDALVATTSAPSNFGAQLTRLRDGLSGTQDPFRARDQVEENLMHQAAIIRCTDAYAARRTLGIYKPAVIEKIQKETHADQGRIALAILRAYHERSTASMERGFVEVYRILRRIAPKTTPPTDEDTELLQLFREGKAKRCRNFAAEAYADSLLGLQFHCKVWNKQHP